MYNQTITFKFIDKLRIDKQIEFISDFTSVFSTNPWIKIKLQKVSLTVFSPSDYSPTLLYLYQKQKEGGIVIEKPEMSEQDFLNLEKMRPKSTQKIRK
ncbi:MAG: hypothetical protein ACSHYA_16785 [Opitutaceae bacterium]